MKHKRLKFGILLLSALGLTALQAQVVIPTTGGNASGSSGSVSYTVGQTVYATSYSGTNGSVAQGVQQPYEISVVMGFENVNISLQCSVQPNPSTDFLILKVDLSSSTSSEPMFYQLYNIDGKRIENNQITSNETSITTTELLPATYILKVLQGNKEIKVFKIIKKINYYEKVIFTINSFIIDGKFICRNSSKDKLSGSCSKQHKRFGCQLKHWYAN